MTEIQVMLASVLVCLFMGCRDPMESAPPTRVSSQPTSTQPATTPATAASQDELNALIARQGSVTFRSFGGKWIGMDGDTDLTFLPNGEIHMFEYGYAVSGYGGTYAIDQQGNITVQLPTFGHAWSAMSLQKDETSLLLVPAREKTGFIMGHRGGATMTPDKGRIGRFAHSIRRKKRRFALRSKRWENKKVGSHGFFNDDKQ